MSSFEKFKREFYSEEKLYSSYIDRYKIVINSMSMFFKVWNTIQIKTMKDYHDLYLKCDVLILADVFEKFESSILKNYGLCQSHYLSAPALS